MKFISVLLGIASFILAICIWLSIPDSIDYIYKSTMQLPKEYYYVGVISSIISGFFWFAIFTILENQSKIMKALDIQENSKSGSKFTGKVF